MHTESIMCIERWLRLMETWTFSPNLNTFEALVAAYSKKGRHYHTEEHVSACLLHLDKLLKQLQHAREVEIALWFHDAIYNPLSSSNEKDSADWAASFLQEQGAASQEVARVYNLIMVTEHNAPTRTIDEAILVDIDLSILGSDPETYRVFENGIRKEYKLVPSFIYRKKRAQILQGFVDRPKIYTSDCFTQDREHQARLNLSNAISELEGLD